MRRLNEQGWCSEGTIQNVYIRRGEPAKLVVIGTICTGCYRFSPADGDYRKMPGASRNSIEPAAVAPAEPEAHEERPDSDEEIPDLDLS